MNPITRDSGNWMPPQPIEIPDNEDKENSVGETILVDEMVIDQNGKEADAIFQNSNAVVNLVDIKSSIAAIKADFMPLVEDKSLNLSDATGLLNGLQALYRQSTTSEEKEGVSVNLELLKMIKQVEELLIENKNEPAVAQQGVKVILTDTSDAPADNMVIEQAEEKGGPSYAISENISAVVNLDDIESSIAAVKANCMPYVEDKFLSLNDATSLLNGLQALYRQSTTYEGKEDTTENLQLLQMIKQVEELVTEKNTGSSVSKRDMDMLKSFFQPPLMKYHIDPTNRVKYLLADNSKLLGIAMSLWTKYGGYTGVEVSKCKRANSFNQLAFTFVGSTSDWYDAIFFKKAKQLSEFAIWKLPAEILSEVLEFIGATNESSRPKEEVNTKNLAIQISPTQQQMHAEIEKILLQSYMDWGYSGFSILTSTEQLRALNLPEKSCHEYHAVALFLPPCIEI